MTPSRLALPGAGLPATARTGALTALLTIAGLHHLPAEVEAPLAAADTTTLEQWGLRLLTAASLDEVLRS